MNSERESDGGLAVEDGSEPENKDADRTEPEEGKDIFKKPALLAVPLLTKRSIAATFKPTAETNTATENDQAQVVDTTQEKSEGPENVSRTAETGRGEDKDGAKDNKQSAPVRIQPEEKHRARPPKGPLPAKFPPLKYTEPSWGGGPPDYAYALEMLKNGTIVDTVPLTQRSYFVVGRLPVCDVALEHPSISRYHAVIQYRSQAGEGESVGEEAGFYVHDLGSTHGTVVNKNKVPPKTYIRLRVGHVLKFGGSTRLFILQVNDEDPFISIKLTLPRSLHESSDDVLITMFMTQYCAAV